MGEEGLDLAALRAPSRNMRATNHACAGVERARRLPNDDRVSWICSTEILVGRVSVVHTTSRTARLRHSQKGPRCCL